MKNVLVSLTVPAFMLLAGCTVSEQSAAVAGSASGPPNIVFILVDDLGWNDVGYHNSEIATPNIDDLAKQGVKLERSYVFPICSPTRAALMTGRNPLQFGIDGPMENDAMLPEQLSLLPEQLRRGGYETWMVGKWHLGMARQSAAPPGRGFDYFYGHLGGFIDFYTHVYFGGLDWQRNGKSVREAGYSTDLLTADAVRLVEQHDGAKPFFLYLSYNAPHTPLQYPPAGGEDYAHIANSDRRVFAQMTTYLDTSIGKLMAALRARNLLENTMIVFMSDNGGNLEAGASNGELRAGKGSALEGGVRVPTIVSWPRQLAADRVFEQPVFVQDWLPTLLDSASVKRASQGMEGVSVWGALTKSETVDRPLPVVIGVGKSKAVYDWPWKLVRGDNKRGETPADRLFNVVNDPLESKDLAAQYPAKADTLAAHLAALPTTESKGARGPAPETLFRDATGAFVYDIRKPETREPWAESATAE